MPQLRLCCPKSTLAISLALCLIMLRLSRASGQDENYAGYRREFYREDDNRISVDTDSYGFAAKLNSTVAISGNVVFDAISGATPKGAPPQSQWPYPTYNQYYANAYSQAYSSQYNQFIAQNQIYYISGYITYDQLTNAAAQAASAAAPGIATNSATSSYQSLTNNPNFRKSAQVPLVHIHDYRSAFSLGVPVTLQNHLITPSFAFSTESDYESFGGALNYSLLLNNKNTTVNLGYSHNSDSVRDDKMVWEEKLSDDILLGIVQLITPKSYLTVNLSLGYESGYLSDPYRGVMFTATTFDQLQTNPDDPSLAPEKRPRHRSKEIFYTAWTQFFEPANGSAEIGYRFFHDSYEIFAQTAELTWHQNFASWCVVSPFFRYYYQNEASFYYPGLVPGGAAIPSYYSSDYRLSQFNSFSAGVRATFRVCKYVSIDLGYMRYVMQGLDGQTSQSAYPSANVGTVGARVWF